VELWVGLKVGILASHILLSQRPNHKEMQVIHFDQDVQVCAISFLILNIFGTPLYNDSLLDECLSEGMGYLYIYFFLLFFLGGYLCTHCFIYSDTFVSIFFSHAPRHGFSLFLA